jgi:hypothetical protein
MNTQLCILCLERKAVSGGFCRRCKKLADEAGGGDWLPFLSANGSYWARSENRQRVVKEKLKGGRK